MLTAVNDMAVSYLFLSCLWNISTFCSM